MPNIALSEARIKTLRSRPCAYDIRDAKLTGFGVRVLPSGAKRFFVHTQYRRQRVWKIVADANVMSIDEARIRAASLLIAIRGGADARTAFDRGDSLRVRFGGRVPTLRADLEASHSLCKSLVLPSSASPLVRGTADSRREPARRSALVRVPSRDAGRRRPLRAGPLGHLQGGRTPGLPARGIQSLSGTQTQPPKGTRAVSVGRRDPSPCDNPVEARSRVPTTGCSPAPPSAHGVSQGRDPYPALVGLP